MTNQEAIETIEANYPPENYTMLREALDIAIAMLKEQKAVEPRKENNGNPEPWTVWWYICGSCGQPIDKMDRYCRRCGREVKWE